MLNKKHFEAIASILSKHNVSLELIEDFGDYFMSEYPNFDWIRFKEACRRNLN